MILRYYLLIVLPTKVILAQTVEINLSIGPLNISMVFNSLMLVFNVIFTILLSNRILKSSTIRPIFIIAVVLLFLCSLQPLFSFVFTKDVEDFANFLKLVDWITTIPLAFLAFHDDSHIRQLKIAAICAFGFVIIGIFIGNLFTIGNTAYDSGIFHLGLWSAEAPLSMAVVFLLPYFFLSPKAHPQPKLFSHSTVFLIMGNLCLLLLIMKRSSILAFLMGFYIILFLYTKSDTIKFSTKYVFFVALSSLIVLSILFSYISISHPDLLEYRFKDIKKYQKSGDISHFGAGRLGLIQHYLDVYFEYPLIQQILGIDAYGYIDKRKGGYLRLGGGAPPHNDYLEFLLRNGLIGLMTYVFFLAISVSRMWTVFKYARTRLTAQLSVIMLGMFSIYFVSSLAGCVFRVFPMTCFAMLFGTSLGVASRDSHSLD